MASAALNIVWPAISLTSSAAVQISATVEVAPSWSITSSLNTARNAHTATLLQNGKVLVAGGSSGNRAFVNSAELYDPDTGEWSYTGNLNTARAAHTATLLPNGKVLVAGGYNYNGGSPTPLNGAEFYDPATGTWTKTGNLSARLEHTATLLANGNVLVVGGWCGIGCARDDAELYDPATGKWTATRPLNSPDQYFPGRVAHFATLLPDGRVLVLGGLDPHTTAWTAPNYTTRLPGDGVLLASSPHAAMVALRRYFLMAKSSSQVAAAPNYTTRSLRLGA